MLHYLVAPTQSFRSGFANIVLYRGNRNRVGADLEWKNRFTPQQIASAPASLQVVLQSENVALVPGPLDADFMNAMRKSGFAVSNYALDADEYNWILNTLPPDKAAAWRRVPSRECGLVVCAGQVRVETQGQGWEQKDRYCDGPNGLKVEEVAKVEGGSLLSDLSSAFQEGLSAVYEWITPSSLQNAFLYSATRQPTQEEKERAMKMIRDYDDMAASVRNLEALEAKGVPMPREVQIRNQVSRMILAQNAQPVSLIKRELGLAGGGSVNRMRRRIRLDHARRDAFGGVFLVVAAVLVASAIAAWIYGSYTSTVVAQEASKQKDMDVKYRQQLASRCYDTSLSDSVRKEICGVLREEAKHPTGAAENKVDWTKFAKWTAVGAVGIAGFFAVRTAFSESASLRQSIRQRFSRRQS